MMSYEQHLPEYISVFIYHESVKMSDTDGKVILQLVITTDGKDTAVNIVNGVNRIITSGHNNLTYIIFHPDQLHRFPLWILLNLFLLLCGEDVL